MANSVVNQVKVGSTTYDMKPYLGSATSGDAASATAWTSVDAIATSDSYDTVFNKVTKMVKNVRYLYSKLGTTDFSGISSTVSGALTTLNTNKAASTHNHDGVYSATNHTHSNYSTTGHTHSNYSTTGHTHSNYASSTHNHDTAYAAKTHSHSEYSTTGHTHSNYSLTTHTHSNYSTTGHTHSYIATSNIVTSQTNSTSKVPAASLVYSMNTTLTSLNDAISNKFQVLFRQGTGTVGTASSPISITFAFAPKIISIMYVVLINVAYTSVSFTHTNLNSYPWCNMEIITTSYSQQNALNAGDGSGYTIVYCQIKKSSDGKTVYYYNSYTGDYAGTASTMYNDSNCKYLVLAYN